jgi:hypothetical protein
MKLFKVFLFIILFILLSFLLFNVLRYIRWEKEFFEIKKSLVCLEDIDVEDEEIEKKIESFIISNNKTEFIVFETDEVLYILKENMELNEAVDIQDICIETNRGVWVLYIQYKTERIRVPWLQLNIVKDDRETPELYVREISIGGRDIPFGMGGRIRTDINRGISEGIILLNENQFLGREITNIELLEDRVVVKGNR